MRDWGARCDRNWYLPEHYAHEEVECTCFWNIGNDGIVDLLHAHSHSGLLKCVPWWVSNVSFQLSLFFAASQSNFRLEIAGVTS